MDESSVRDKGSLKCGCDSGKDIWCEAHLNIRAWMERYDGIDGHQSARGALLSHTADIERLEAELTIVRADRMQMAIGAYLINAISLEEIAQACGLYSYTRIARMVRHSRMGWPPIPRSRRYDGPRGDAKRKKA